MRQSKLGPSILLLMLMSATLALPLGGQTSSAQPDGKLRGVLTDVSGRPVAGATILIKGTRIARNLTTNTDGTYQIELPADLYHLSVSGWKDFSPALRAAFRLSPTTTSVLNLILIERGTVAIPYPGAKPDEFFDDGPSVSIKYELLPLAQPLNSMPPEIGVQFGEKHLKGSVIEYKAELMYRGHSLYGDPHPGVVVSYNLTTIYANRARFNRKSSRLEAEGNVIVENDGKRTHARRAEVDFTVEKPVVRLKF